MGRGHEHKEEGNKAESLCATGHDSHQGGGSGRYHPGHQGRHYQFIADMIVG